MRLFPEREWQSGRLPHGVNTPSPQNRCVALPAPMPYHRVGTASAVPVEDAGAGGFSLGAGIGVPLMSGAGGGVLSASLRKLSV